MDSDHSNEVPQGGEPRLLERVKNALALRHYSSKTAEAYVGWIRRFVLFHGRRHPDAMGARDVVRFVSSLASGARVSASTQNQALAALLFLYSQVLRRELGSLPEIVWAKRPTRLPVVMTRDEVGAVLAKIRGVCRLMASLLYGSGLRLLECATLRVKDLQFGSAQIVVRRGKGNRDRVTMLPHVLVKQLELHLENVRQQHERDVADGAGFVGLPNALALKYPRAGREWAWQWVFPATRIGVKSPLDLVELHSARPRAS
jgi:integron integrase